MVMETELIVVQSTSKQYLNFMLAVLARIMAGELDVCMRAYVVLQSDFLWMYFVKRDGYLECLWLVTW